MGSSVSVVSGNGPINVGAAPLPGTNTVIIKHVLVDANGNQLVPVADTTIQALQTAILAFAQTALTVASLSTAPVRNALVWKGRTTIADAAYTILPTDTIVAMTALTANRTLTLPAAATYDPRQPLIILDESGVPPASMITIACAGSDIIVTGGNVTSASIGSPGQKTTWHTDGVSKWTYAG